MDGKYDVIIAGTGAGGLYSALSLPQSLKILIITKRELMLCNSALAQGGIAGVYKPVDDDNIQLHTNDTLVAGGFKNNPDSLKVLVTEAAQEIGHLIDLGVDFDRTADGELHRTLEGGHSRHRIFHHKDSTGYEITARLADAAKKLPNVTIAENALLCDVQKVDGGFSCDILKDDVHHIADGKFMILATGDRKSVV